MIVLNACPAPRGIGEASVTGDARRALAAFGVPVAAISIGSGLSCVDVTRAEEIVFLVARIAADLGTDRVVVHERRRRPHVG